MNGLMVGDILSSVNSTTLSRTQEVKGFQLTSAFSNERLAIFMAKCK